MTNQQCMRRWDEGHSPLSADADRRAAVLARHLSRRDQLFFGIGPTYNNDNEHNDRALLPILSGFAAVVATTVLVLGAAMMAVPGSIFTTLA